MTHDNTSKIQEQNQKLRDTTKFVHIDFLRCKFATLKHKSNKIVK